MGGVVPPLGYRVEDRALHIVEDHAEIVRSLFRRYLEAGSVVRLKPQLDAEGFRLPVRIDGAGRSTGRWSAEPRPYLPRSCQIHILCVSAGSPIRAKRTKASTSRSCLKTCGTKSNGVLAIVVEPS